MKPPTAPQEPPKNEGLDANHEQQSFGVNMLEKATNAGEYTRFNDLRVKDIKLVRVLCQLGTNMGSFYPLNKINL